MPNERSTASVIRSFLSQVAPFDVLAAEDLDRIANQSLLRYFSKGEAIYTEGETAESIWILMEGRIQVFKYTSEGRPHAIQGLSAKELMGLFCRLSGSTRAYPCTATPATDCTVIQIADRTFLEVYNRVPAFVASVCSLCSKRLNTLQAGSCLSQEPVEKRIAKMLLQLSQQQGNELMYTKREISELVGTTVETTIRTVSVFAKKGWVSSSRGKMTIHSSASLQKLLDTR